MAKIVISEFMDESVIHDVLSDYDVNYDPTLVDKPQELASAIADAKAIIVRNRTQVNEQLLVAAPKLRVVGRLGVGLDNIDLQACAARNVPVLPATGANDLAVAEYVITATLMLLRGAWLSSQSMIAGQWPRTDLIGREVAGKVLGLVGFGSIARETATRATALGMQIAAYDPYLSEDDPAWAIARCMSLPELAANCNVISLHVPLTNETQHLIDADLIKRMRHGTILVNTSRGGVVDEIAVADALRDGHLGGAALDVFESEPLEADTGSRFEGVPNLLLTPHIAGVTAESNTRVSQVTAANILKYLT